MLGESENMEPLSRLIGRQPPFALILFLHCTTNVLLGYCLGGRLSTSSHSFRMLLIRDDVLVVVDLFMAYPTDPILAKFSVTVPTA
jgi:hypothetical protein